MRIFIAMGADPCDDGIAGKFVAMLSDGLQKAGNVMTAEQPDVIHVVGAWNSDTMKAANKASTHHLPMVFTPLGTLSPWHRPSFTHQKLANGATLIVASGTMEHELLDDKKPGLRLVLNAVTTYDTTAEKMTEAYLKVYQEAIQMKDDELWERVNHKIAMLNEDDPTIVKICRKLLYAKFLNLRGSIPQPLLDDIAALMIRSDYDEDRMANVLSFCGLYDFTRRLEYLMQETSSLTEGFMPLPPLDDTVAKDMTKKMRL